MRRATSLQYLSGTPAVFNSFSFLLLISSSFCFLEKQKSGGKSNKYLLCSYWLSTWKWRKNSTAASIWLIESKGWPLNGLPCFGFLVELDSFFKEGISCLYTIFFFLSYLLAHFICVLMPTNGSDLFSFFVFFFLFFLCPIIELKKYCQNKRKGKKGEGMSTYLRTRSNSALSLAAWTARKCSLFFTWFSLADFSIASVLILKENELNLVC